MNKITFYLASNKVEETEIKSADNLSVQLVVDFTGTGFDTWTKYIDFRMSDGTSDIQTLGTDAIVTFDLTSAHTKVGDLLINPYCMDGSSRKGFPIKSIKIGRQLANGSVTATVQTYINGYIEDRIAELGLDEVSNKTYVDAQDALKADLAYVDAQILLKSDATHVHDDRYYTETESDALLAAKSASSHLHDDRYFTETEVTTALGLKADKTQTINEKALSGNITINAIDVPNTPTGNISALTVQGALNELDTDKADASHTHDTRYYTESETDTLLGGKANTSHSHDDLYFTETEITTLLSGKSDTSHTHDDRYYTETEIGTLFTNYIIVSATEPTTPATGQLWLDTSV